MIPPKKAPRFLVLLAINIVTQPKVFVKGSASPQKVRFIDRSL
jgi:hypothetical protein